MNSLKVKIVKLSKKVMNSSLSDIPIDLDPRLVFIYKVTVDGNRVFIFYDFRDPQNK